MNMAVEAEQSSAGEPWGGRLWVAVAIVVVIAFALQSHNISTWPMADDEVPTLVELGMVKIVPSAFSVPAVQLERGGGRHVECRRAAGGDQHDLFADDDDVAAPAQHPAGPVREVRRAVHVLKEP